MEHKRDHSLDLLRIICMMMVVCAHLITWDGLFADDAQALTPMWLAGNTMFAFTLPCVNCFVLISGYFLCTAKFKLKRLVSLWVQVVTYSVVIYLLVSLFHEGTAFSVSGLLMRIPVITLERYWFITAYVLMYAVSPFLNIAIHAMDKKTHALCCLVLIGIFSVLANLVYTSDFSNINGGYCFLWFCIMYIIAAYIRLYVPTRVKHQKWMFPSYILCALIICGEKFLAYLITPRIFGSVMLEGLFYSYNSILAVPMAVSLFQGFRGLQIRSPLCNKLIAFFAPLTLAAYLIHGHMSFADILLDAVGAKAYSDSILVFPYLVGATILIVFVSCQIEWLRKQILHLCRIDRCIDRTCDRLQTKVTDLISAQDHSS